LFFPPYRGETSIYFSPHPIVIPAKAGIQFPPPQLIFPTPTHPINVFSKGGYAPFKIPQIYMGLTPPIGSLRGAKPLFTLKGGGRE